MLCTWPETRFNSLLMFAGERPVNISRLSGDIASTYVEMAIRLAESLGRAGKNLRVFTNDPERLLALAGPGARLITPIPLEINPLLPPDIPFYAAHHKLDIFRHFSREAWPNCFLDLDVLLFKDAAEVQQRLESPQPMEAWVYDISGQVFPAYSRPTVQQDLKKLGASNAFPRWYGGEFLLGIPSFYTRLSTECARVLPTYLSIRHSLHHLSDEPIVSVAINSLANEFAIGDAGDAELIVRYWSSRTLHVQQDARVLRRCAFWHLPDMKWALSRAMLSRTPWRLTQALSARRRILSLLPKRG